MINHVIRIVTDTVTTTLSVTEMIVAVRKIRHATVTKAVTDRLTLKHQKKKIRVKTKEAMTMRQKNAIEHRFRRFSSNSAEQNNFLSL